MDFPYDNLLKSLCDTVNTDYRPQRVGLLFELLSESHKTVTRTTPISTIAHSFATQSLDDKIIACLLNHGFSCTFPSAIEQQEFMTILSSILHDPFLELEKAMGYSHWLQTKHMNKPTLFLCKTYQHKKPFPLFNPSMDNLREIFLSIQALPALRTHLDDVATRSEEWRLCVEQLTKSQVTHLHRVSEEDNRLRA